VPVEIEQSAEGPGSVVRLNGDVGICAARELKAALVEALAFSGVLKIDLAGVTAMDITTLQLLWAAQHAAAKAGTQVILARPMPEAVKQAMELAGMEGLAVNAQ
jgi:anti-anti-sigma factor